MEITHIPPAPRVPSLARLWVDLFTPDITVVPSGHSYDHVGQRAEYRLAYAILESALYELLRGWYPGATPKALRIARVAEEWFASDAEEHVFDFLPLCEMLNLNSHGIRQAIFRQAATATGIPRRRRHRGVSV